MLVSHDATFIHMPKTGGTFVTAMLKSVWLNRTGAIIPAGIRYRLDRRGRQASPLLHPSILVKAIGYAELSKHGGRRAVPPAHSAAILGCVRHPLDRLVSSYEFGLWRRAVWSNPAWLEDARQVFPHYPDLTFDEYLETQRIRAYWLGEQLSLRFEPGIESALYLRFYARDLSSYAGLSAEEAATQLRSDVADVVMLRTEHLNDDLANFLEQRGAKSEIADHVREARRILPTSTTRARESRSWQDAYSPAAADAQAARESLFFSVFTAYSR